MDVFSLYATIGIKADEFNRGIDNAQKKFKSFSDNIKSISDGISKSYSGLKDVLSPAVDGFKAVEGVGKKAGNAITTGLKGFAAAATAVGGFGTAAVKSGMQFDATMSEVSAISGATGQEFDALRDKALEMGAKTKFSASEAGEAMTYMGMAGWKAGDMISGIEGIMNLAAASGEDLATTSDIVTDALTAFGLQASDSGHFANVMAVAASNANTNVGMMGETFKYVAPVAGALGYSVDDTALAIGLMANSGIKATQAGTALRSIFTRLSTDAGASSKSLGALGTLTEKLGVEFYNTDGSARNLNDVLVDSRAAWAGLSEEQQITYAKTIAGQEAMSGWLALMNAAPADVDKLTAALEDCNGAAEKMAATMVDNLQGDLILLGSAFESLQIAISDGLTPTLREFAQFGQKAMSSLLEGFQGGGVSGFMDALEGIVTESITMLAAKAEDFVYVGADFILALSNGVLDAKDSILEAGRDVIDFLINVFGEYLRIVSPEMAEFGLNIVSLIFDGFSQAGEIISDVIGNFIPLIAQGFLAYHETLFTVGVDILGAIGQGIIDNKEEIGNIASETITNMVTSLRDNAPMIIEGGIALLEALAGAIVENLPLIMETGAEIIGKLIEGIATASPGVQAIIGTAVLPHIMKIIDVVGGIGQAVGGVVQLVSGGISTIMGIGSKLMGGIQALFALIMAHPVVAVVTAIIAAVMLLWQNCEAFRDAVKAIWDAIVGFFQAAAEGIKAAFDGVVEFFSGVWEGIKAAFSTVAEVLGGFFSAAAEAVQAAWSAVVDFFRGVWDGIRAVFESVAEVLGGFFRAAVEAVQSAWEAVVSFFSGIWDGIQGVFSNVAEVLGGFFKAAWEAVQTAWNAAKEFFSGIADGIRSVFETVTQFLGEAFSAAWEAVQSVWEGAKEFFSGVWNAIRETGQSAISAVGDAFKSGWESIKSAWGTAKDFFSGVWDSITGVFSGALEHFKSIGSNIMNGLINGIKEKFTAVKTAVGNVVDGIKNVFTGKSGFDEHSPSKWANQVFRYVLEGGVDGLDAGSANLLREVDSIVGKVKSGLNFGAATVGVTGNYSGAQGSAGISGKPGFGGDFVVNIYNPEKRDPVTEAREWKKTMQRAAMDYV